MVKFNQEITQQGTDNEGQENKKGYSQAVSGLCDMTEEYDRMFTAEGKYWNKFKEQTPDLWDSQLARFRHTRGTIFTNRLLECIKWLNRNE